MSKVTNIAGEQLTADETPKKAKGTLDCALIIGYDNRGNLVQYASSNVSIERAVFLADSFRHAALKTLLDSHHFEEI